MPYRGSRSRARSAKRETDWGSIDITSTTLASGAVIIGSLNAAALAMRPFTIVRTYVELYMISDQAGAVETQAAAYGVAVVSEQASAIGVTAVPTPVTDMASDLWFVHQVMFGDSSPGLTDRSLTGAHYQIDSKAMRKVNADEDIVFVLEQGGIGGGIIVKDGGRFLIKLH